MSTRSDVEYGEHFWLGSEIFEAGKVYLELTGDDVEFIATAGSIRVAIPAEVWEKIRKHGIEEFDWIFRPGEDKTL